MKKRLLSLLLALVLVLGLVPVTARADSGLYGDTNGNGKVDVYLSMSSDDKFLVGADTTTIMALKPISVPYFDIGPYGLSGFYFSSENYNDDGDGKPGSDIKPGTQETANGKITMLHLLIYATELLDQGWPEKDCGKGNLYDLGLMGVEVNGEGPQDQHRLFFSGTLGSSFINQIWGVDMNLNYYHNYEYPTAYIDYDTNTCWGKTSDQTLLKDGDIITVGHFYDVYYFYSDPYSIFNYIKSDKNTVTQGEQVEMQVLRAGPNLGGAAGTAQTPVVTSPEIFYCKTDDIHGPDVTGWITTDVYADEEGYFTLDTTNMAPGTYMIAVPGMSGLYTDEIVSSPGGMLLTVLGDEPEAPKVMYGDSNGDKTVNTLDAAVILLYAAEEEVTIDLTAADVNGDKVVNTLDAALVLQYAAEELDKFPVESNS